jgi:hypothetical protein
MEVVALQLLEDMCLKISSKWENEISKVELSVEVTVDSRDVKKEQQYFL